MTTQFFRSSITNIFSTSSVSQQLKNNTIMFSNLSNIVCLMGGNLKKSQVVSGRMADLFSQLYFGYSILYHREKYNLDTWMYDVCLTELNKEFYDSFNKLKEELPPNLRLLTKISCRNPSYNKVNNSYRYYLSNIIWKNDRVKEYIENQIYVEDNILGKIKEANETDNEDEREKLIDDIISVGEYKKNIL